MWTPSAHIRHYFNLHSFIPLLVMNCDSYRFPRWRQRCCSCELHFCIPCSGFRFAGTDHSTFSLSSPHFGHIIVSYFSRVISSNFPCPLGHTNSNIGMTQSSMIASVFKRFVVLHIREGMFVYPRLPRPILCIHINFLACITESITFNPIQPLP